MSHKTNTFQVKFIRDYRTKMGIAFEKGDTVKASDAVIAGVQHLGYLNAYSRLNQVWTHFSQHAVRYL